MLINILIILILIFIILLLVYIIIKWNKLKNSNQIKNTRIKKSPLLSYIDNQDFLLNSNYYIPYSHEWYLLNYPYWIPYNVLNYNYYLPNYGYNRYRNLINKHHFYHPNRVKNIKHFNKKISRSHK